MLKSGTRGTSGPEGLMVKTQGTCKCVCVCVYFVHIFFVVGPTRVNKNSYNLVMALAMNRKQTMS